MLLASGVRSLLLPSPSANPHLSPSPVKRNLLLRVVDAMADANRRKAERVVAAYVQRNGGKFTDRLERGVERFFL